MVSYEQFYDDILRQYLHIESMPVAGYCQKVPSGNNAAEAYHQSILCVKKYAQDTIAFVDKKIPHGLYDMMIMSLDESPIKSAPTDLDRNTVFEIFSLARKFLQFVSQHDIITEFGLNNGRFHLCYNYDPDTLDRESGMSEKLFHLHLNYWTENQLDFSLARKMNNLNFMEFRKFIDPLTIIAERVLCDMLYNVNLVGKIMTTDAQRDVECCLPDGLKIEYPSWDVLIDMKFIDEIRFLHETINKAYNIVSDCFFQEGDIQPTPWYRRKLKEKVDIFDALDKCSFLSYKSRCDLKILASLLRDIPLDIMERLKQNKAKRIQMLSMGGLNYSLGMYSPQSNSIEKPINQSQQILIVIKAKLFAANGGAGIIYTENVPFIKLQRNAFAFTQQEIRKRSKFQADYLEACFSDVDSNLQV